MANFRLIDDWPMNTPGNCCFLCRSSLRDLYGPDRRREQVIDTGAMIGDPERPGEYPLALCESCVCDLGHLVGMLTPTELAGQMEASKLAADEQLAAENADLRAALETLERVGYVPAEPESSPEPPEPAAKAAKPNRSNA